MEACRFRTPLLAILMACCLSNFAPVSAAPASATLDPTTSLLMNSGAITPVGAYELAMTGNPAIRAGLLPRPSFRSADKMPPLAISKRLYQRWQRYHLAHPRAVRPSVFAKSAPVASFATDAESSIWELNAAGSVVGALTDCSGAEGAKVDTYGNLWVACTFSSTINLYTPGATKATLSLNDTAGGVAYYPADVALDGAGDVYVTNLESVSGGNGNVVFWSASTIANGATPTGAVNDVNVVNGYFLDTDGVGDLYIDYLNPPCPYGGVDQVISPQSNAPTVTVIIQPCTGQLQFPGGIYTSNFETQLNVLDQETGLIAEFPIVVQSVGGSTGSLGPVGASDPVAMGWNQADSQILAGAAGSQEVVFGTVKSNSWVQENNPDFQVPIGGTYVASDKFQPQYIGEDHLAVVQAAIENRSAIIAIAGPNPTGQDLLEAMLQVPQIPQETKNIISEMLLVPQVSLSSQCQAAATKFINGFPKNKTFAETLSYMKKAAQLKTPCYQYYAGVEGAIAIAEAGKSTIYNPKWLKTHEPPGFELPPWGDILGADAEGAIDGFAEGPWGILAVGGAFSVITALTE